MTESYLLSSVSRGEIQRPARSFSCDWPYPKVTRFEAKMPSAEFRGRLAGAARGSGGSTRWRSICPPFDARWRRPKAPVGLRPEFVWSFAGIVATRLGWPTGGPSGEHVPVGHPADRSSRQHRTRRHRAGEKKRICACFASTPTFTRRPRFCWRQTWAPPSPRRRRPRQKGS